MELSTKIKSVVRDVVDFPRPGIVFKDITPVLASPHLMREIIAELVETYRGHSIDAIVGIEARGFILGSILAHELGCSFVPARKPGKLPYKTKSMGYTLEYGTGAVEMHTDAFGPGNRVLIHDDLLATGGTALAAGELVKSLGGNVVAFSFLINLSFLEGGQRIKDTFGLAPSCLVNY